MILLHVASEVIVAVEERGSDEGNPEGYDIGI